MFHDGTGNKSVMIQQFNQQNINSYLHHNVVFVRLKVVAFSDAEKAAGVRFSARFFRLLSRSYGA